MATKAHNFLSVEWRDKVSRDDWSVEYVPVGSLPGVIRGISGIGSTGSKLLSQTAFLTRRSRRRENVGGHAKRVAGLFAKFLQRGEVPLPTLGIERAALERHGLIGEVDDLSERGVELGWVARKAGRFSGDDAMKGLLSELVRRNDFDLDSEVADSLGNDSERRFIRDWVPRHLGRSAGHWIVPDVPVSSIMEASGQSWDGDEKVGLMFALPRQDPFVVEVVGSPNVKDEVAWTLEKVGIHTIQVNAKAVDLDMPSNGLEEVVQRYEEFESKLEPVDANLDIAEFVLDCAIGSKIQFVLVRAIEYGWLFGRSWSIEIEGGGSAALVAVEDALNLLAAYDVLLGGECAPAYCLVKIGGKSAVQLRRVDGKFERCDAEVETDSSLRVVIDWRSSPSHAGPFDANTDFVIRGAYLPVNLRVEPSGDPARCPIECSDFQAARPALREFLKQIFRKVDFRHGQAETVFDVLRHQDRVVLLSTGAGKSIIYQLAGMLMPGITVVVDPIVALIDDQVAGLNHYGIDRVVGISSQMDAQEKSLAEAQLMRPEYWFVLVSPERLQIREFRESLLGLRGRTLINLSVVDEAHCVSEWGHDFRPSYLQLRRRLLETCSDAEGTPPPLLALTATASRSVLRDVIADLEIDLTEGEAIVKPESFDRPELVLSVERAGSYVEAKDILRRVVAEISVETSGVAAGDGEKSGIVFTRTVNGSHGGLESLRKEMKSVVSGAVGLYSGAAPNGFPKGATWDAEKRQTAQNFRSNTVRHLVATKAYGMGIDKPDIRYVVHYGMPSSLEGFYQEAGRAGRDGEVSQCVVIFCEADARRNSGLLDPNADFDEVMRRQDRKVDFHDRDDVSSAFYFHSRGFRGVRAEMIALRSVVKDLMASYEVVPKIPFDSGEIEQVEREYALARLKVLRFVDDYEVVYGARQFRVRRLDFEYPVAKSALLEYVARSQPAEAQHIETELGTIERDWSEDHDQQLFGLARFLIEFIYNTVEAASRGKIREAMLLARGTSSGKDFKARMLDYFRDGVASNRIDALLEEGKVDLVTWVDLIVEFTPANAGELRGQCLRALESSPTHPGLLLVRGVTETMTAGHDSSVSWQQLAVAIENMTRLDLGGYVEETFERLFDLSDCHSFPLGPALAHALLDRAESDSGSDWCRDLALSRGDKAETDREMMDAVIGVYETGRVVAAIGGTVERLVALSNDENVCALLGLKEETIEPNG